MVDAALDERFEGAGYAQVLRQLLQRRPRVLPDELVRVCRARKQHLRMFRQIVGYSQGYSGTDTA